MQTSTMGGVAPLMGVGDLAALIGVPVATIYDWRTRGLGPVAYRFGKHLRFAAADVAAWMASMREDQTSVPSRHDRGVDPSGHVR